MQFLLLNWVAKRLFGIPATSAPCEGVFSIAGSTLEKRRINFQDDNVDAVLFIHSLFNNSEDIPITLILF